MLSLVIKLLAIPLSVLAAIPGDPPRDGPAELAQPIGGGEVRQPLRHLSIPLHYGWNLISLNLYPGVPNQFGAELQFREILDSSQTWFYERQGKLYTYRRRDNPFPMFPESSLEMWDLNQAYYIYLEDSCTWRLEGCPPPREFLDWFYVSPGSAWDDNRPLPDHENFGWFFIGYAGQDDRRLASIPKRRQTQSGDPDHFHYLGPFHWLIWENDSSRHYPRYDLKIVKTDDGRVYIPTLDSAGTAIDQIKVLQPGRGYFLGFYSRPEEDYYFEGWGRELTATERLYNSNLPPPERLPDMTRHFRYNWATHWSYPIVMDTLDMAEAPLEAGDEIGVFDGDLCVGAVTYRGQFPLVIAAWEKDMATSFLDRDGYMPGQPMRFVWYDRSQNAEAQLIDEPDSAAADPVAPQYAGFGAGLYARRSFTQGLRWVKRLPRQYDLCQPTICARDSITAIELQLPQRSKVKLEIFNVKGERLGVPYEHIYEVGWAKIRWNAAKLPSGIYFYRITADGLERGGKFSDIGKMLLLK